VRREKAAVKKERGRESFGRLTATLMRFMEKTTHRTAESRMGSDSKEYRKSEGEPCQRKEGRHR